MDRYVHGLLMVGSGLVMALAFVPPAAPLFCAVIFGVPAMWSVDRYLSLEEHRQWRTAAKVVRQRRTATRAETG